MLVIVTSEESKIIAMMIINLNLKKSCISNLRGIQRQMGGLTGAEHMLNDRTHIRVNDNGASYFNDHNNHNPS
jgi:hypothetical protein